MNQSCNSRQLMALEPLPLVEYYGRSENFPTNQLHHITLSDKVIFIASPNGLIVYYGENFRVLDRSNGLLSHGLRTTTRSSYGGLISSDKGLNHMNLDGEHIFSIDTSELGFGWCQKAVEYKKDHYLLATAKGLLSYSHLDGHLKRENVLLEGEVINHLITNRSGDCLVHSNASGLWVFSDNTLAPYLTSTTLQHSDIIKVGRSLLHSWVLMDTKILLLDLSFNLLSVIDLPSELHFPITACVFGDAIYVATSSQLIKLTLADNQLVSQESVLNNTTINDIKIDDNYNIWLASERKGLIKISGLREHITINTHTKSNSILSLRMHHNRENTCIVGGSEQSYLFDLNEQRIIAIIQDLQAHPAWDVQSSNGGYYCATQRGLVIIDNEESRTVHYETTGACRCLELSSHHILLGSISGLYWLEYETFNIKPLLDNETRPLGYVYTIYKVKPNVYLIGTLGRGLWLLEHADNNISHYSLKPVTLKLDISNVYGVDINEQGLVAITADCYVIILDKDYQYLSHIEEPNSVSAWCCVWSNNNELIAGASNGLKLFNIKDGELIFRLDNFPSSTYWEFTTSRSLLKASSNKLLCGLNDFIATIDFERLKKEVRPPIPSIFNIKCTTEYELKNNILELKTGPWELQVWLASFWYWAKDSCHYRYRLLGLSEDFSPIFGNRINFNSLPSGNYILEVKVTNNFENNSRIHQILLIQVRGKGLVSYALNALYNFWVNKFQRHFRSKEFVKLHGRYLELEAQVEERTLSLGQREKELREKNQQLKELTGIDPMTKVANRSRFDEVFEKEIYRALRNQNSLSLIMLDIDHFKNYNDTYGHIEGDYCIQSIADCISKCFIRKTDLVARYGGEEFAVLLPNSDQKGVEALAERVRQSVESLNLPHKSSKTSDRVTISVGATSIALDSTYSSFNIDSIKLSIIKHADEALYQSKNSGRNQTSFKPTTLS